MNNLDGRRSSHVACLPDSRMVDSAEDKFSSIIVVPVFFVYFCWPSREENPCKMKTCR